MPSVASPLLSDGTKMENSVRVCARRARKKAIAEICVDTPARLTGEFAGTPIGAHPKSRARGEVPRPNVCRVENEIQRITSDKLHQSSRPGTRPFSCIDGCSNGTYSASAPLTRSNGRQTRTKGCLNLGQLGNNNATRPGSASLHSLTMQTRRNRPWMCRSTVRF